MSYKHQFFRILVVTSIALLAWVVITVSNIKTVLALDYPIAQINPNNLNVGKQLYLENCAGCHIPLPPQILPTDSWQNLLNNSRNHYGESLPKISNLTTRLMWNYLRVFSRPSLQGERTPEYVTNSRYLKALHPQIDLPKPTTHQSCTLCHPKAAQLDYRSLSDEWSLD
ncbi:MAG: cytochrome C [Xenococcaceae cyanobacterium MO_207.B15]|nr:cytochrome C [Xenococcaceae cyanobacterium MO_207.B15]